jgi:hypothetical protein
LREKLDGTRHTLHATHLRLCFVFGNLSGAPSWRAPSSRCA